MQTVTVGLGSNKVWGERKMRLAAMMYESCLWQDAYIVCYGELLPVFCLIPSPTEGVGISPDI